MNNYYSGTSLHNLVTLDSNYGGYQKITIPHTGTYNIEAWGASGGEYLKT